MCVCVCVCVLVCVGGVYTCCNYIPAQKEVAMLHAGAHLMGLVFYMLYQILHKN